MKKVEISIITVNFGSSQNVVNFYTSILKFPPTGNWELIIVDNPTKLGKDAKFLEDYFAKKEGVHIIKLSKNIGYGEGNNEGVKFAQGKFIAICNPDTEVLPQTFDHLIDEIKNSPKTGIAVPRLRTKEGEILENCRKFPTIKSLLSRRLLRRSSFINKNNNQRETEWAQGSFWILKKSLYRDVNGFDDSFFLFMEDIDFCRRVKQKGFSVIRVAHSIAIHSPNRLSGGFIGSAVFRKTFWIHLWSAFLYFKKWH